MKYYVKVILENGLISQDIDVFSTMEEAKMFKNLSEKAGNKAEIYEIELIPAELEKLHEYKIVSKLSVKKLQEQLNTAKYFFKNILDVNPNLNKGHVSHLDNCVRVMKNSAEKALAALEAEEEE